MTWFGNGARRRQEELLRSLLVMAWVVEARDPYTGGHLWRVAQMVRVLAQDAGLSPAEISHATVGGFLHDLGKVAVPDAVLRKADKLDDAEYDVIKTHPEAGWRMLSGHPLAAFAEAGVRCHHERPDGRGYPRGLAAGEIPRDALLISVADAFDAMTSSRPYRAGMPIDRALGIVEENLGTQFDAEWGRRFVAVGRAGAFDHIVGHSDDGIPLQECFACGPIVVVRRGQRAGDVVYCRNCGTEYRVTNAADGELGVERTGSMGDANALQPEVDTDLIRRFVSRSARSLATALA